jgi:hypothetical protein
MEEACSRVEMAIIRQITERPRPATASDGNRQNDVAPGHLGGRQPRHGRRGGQDCRDRSLWRIIASCLANGLSSSNFTQARRDLGTGLQLMSAPTKRPASRTTK